MVIGSHDLHVLGGNGAEISGIHVSIEGNKYYTVRPASLLEYFFINDDLMRGFDCGQIILHRLIRKRPLQRVDRLGISFPKVIR